MNRTRVGLTLGLLVALGCNTASSRQEERSDERPSDTEGVGQQPDVRASLPSASREAVAEIERETHATWHVDVAGRNTRMSGRAAWLASSRDRKATVVDFLSRHHAALGMVDPRRELGPAIEQQDALSMSHLRFKQLASGVTVRGGEVLVHVAASGRTVIDSGYLAGAASVDVRPLIDLEAARDRAIEDVRSKLASPSDASFGQLGELVVAEKKQVAGDFVLAYEVSVRVDGDEPNLWVYRVDAKTGDVVSRHSNLHTVEGTGKGVLGDAKKIQVTQNGTTFTLLDASRTPKGISTHDYQNRTTADAFPGPRVSSNSATVWDEATTAANAKGSAVDAHFYAGAVYDFYKTDLGRLGIDAKDGAIVSSVHVARNYANAFWDPELLQMAYGDGDGSRFIGMSAGLDVVAHELTHGVTNLTSDLIYLNQPGALNESVSDIFGAFCEHKAQPNEVNNWLVGEAVRTDKKALRDMVHPSKGLTRQPAHMKEFLNLSEDEDSGGVHINSGIPNNAAFLMTMGGENDVSKVKVDKGIGWEKSAKLWYRINTTYLRQQSDFAAAAAASLTAAKDLQFTADETAIVECAWIATGILPGACKELTPAADPVEQGPGDEDGTPAAEGDDDDASGSSKSKSKTPAQAPKFADTNNGGCSVHAVHGATGGELFGGLGLAVGLAAMIRRRRR